MSRSEHPCDSPAPAAPEHGGEQGFALVVVLWLIGLLAVYAAALASTSGSYVLIARNDVASERAELIADTGIRLAMRDLLRTNGGTTRFPPGQTVACHLPEGETIRITVTEETGKIDLNVADEELLRALFVGLGLDEAQAVALAETIADFRDADSARRPNGAEAPEYLAAGRPAPKNAPFDSVDELGRVLGVSRELVERALPYVTVHSGKNGIDTTRAVAGLVEMLSRGGTVPPRFATASSGMAYTINAEATTTAGLRIGREAIVKRQDGVASSRNLAAAAADPSIIRLRQLGRDAGGPAGDWVGIALRPVSWRRGAVRADTEAQLPGDGAEALPPC